MNMTLKGTNLTVTDPLRTFVDKKVRACLRALGDMNLDPVQIQIELEKTNHRHVKEREDEGAFRAEATVKLPGQTIRVEESAMEIEQAVVKMKHTLTRELRHWRERIIEKKRSGARKAKSQLVATEPLEGMPQKTDGWEEDWEKEEEKARELARLEEEKRWEEWEEGGEDQRDYVC